MRVKLNFTHTVVNLTNKTCFTKDTLTILWNVFVSFRQNVPKNTT